MDGDTRRYGVLGGRLRRSALGPEMRAQSSGEWPGARATRRDREGAGALVCVGGGASEEDPGGPRLGIGSVERDSEDADGEDCVSGGRRGGCGAPRERRAGGGAIAPGRGGGAIVPGRGGGAMRPGWGSLFGADSEGAAGEREKLGTGAAAVAGAAEALGVVATSSSSVSLLAVIDGGDFGTSFVFSIGASPSCGGFGDAASFTSGTVLSSPGFRFSSVFRSAFGDGGSCGVASHNDRR
ncbi:hypothetical protein PpBr36_07569 [Pyricularia pennisetigena]|uniref:hypothetical protein n=1 Tax=Pyricularia pennisetigena TaxID=1578925 RepID=UPI0011535A74|nr:hypothetical protein PpBr36_07569 [Pyricularia pennisetigena]TLS25214.1 hypothetical protein PpBr36_07569 [Pyricularia pennisetigena]